jgi:folate-dependent phosphoribosylglycinamide formyltransferase PurN
MVEEILLLTEQIEAEGLKAILRRHSPSISITHVGTRVDLESVVARGLAGKRLIGFCTPVIVSKAILDALDGPAYNFHPGPPDYPGLYPACFAINSRADQFGVTAHEMWENVDEGPIVGVDRQKISLDIDRMHLETLSHAMIIQLFERLAPALVGDTPLPPVDEHWSGTVTRQADFEAICEVASDISLEDLELRYRAVGQGPEHSLNVKLHGVRFNLDTRQGGDPGDGKVYVGGREVT